MEEELEEVVMDDSISILSTILILLRGYVCEVVGGNLLNRF